MAGLKWELCTKQPEAGNGTEVSIRKVEEPEARCNTFFFLLLTKHVLNVCLAQILQNECSVLLAADRAFIFKQC
jgi:hypothetical protein